MAATSELDRVAMVVLRYLRKPFFAIILVYAVGITGMALIPGQDADGNPQYMSLFHAFYFFTYTATTTGFGEIPSAFTDAQRLWAIFCLYTGVIAWFYAIGSTVRLLQNPHFLQAVNEHGFARSVRQIPEPFFVVCGFGDTGSLLARGISDNHLRAVIIDKDPERIKALTLRDYTIRMPGLCADASVPKHLVDAGVQNANCKAVVVLTNNEDANLKITVMVKYLNPQVRVICRSTSQRHEHHLRELEDVTVVDPFEIFAQLMSMAITNPMLHNLNGWLVGAHGVSLGQPVRMSPGRWILCGYGRMGHWLEQYINQAGIETIVIDPDIDPASQPANAICQYADRHALELAGAGTAAGIVACTNSDADNLSILLSARQLNPGAFTIVRQNDHENQLAFDAASVDLVLQSSLTTARRVLKILISPLIQKLIDYMHLHGEVETWAAVQRLHEAIGNQAPHLWRVNLCADEARAVDEYFDQGKSLILGDLIKDPNRKDSNLQLVPLTIERDGNKIMLPDNSQPLQCDDEIVFCGTERSEKLLLATMNNPYTLHYLVTGQEMPRGYIFDWFSRLTRGTTVRVDPYSTG